ncbi:interleukin-13 receptor subunit alpha-1-like isoform X3 [Ahaetulla prasina]|uniref:interleukin-13 receptor subunit alpha-1-like isoform X3 n=1 Tax=Ahaetulla prasina TaxID=499056 RepID=UPI0026472CD1|nr:interleukin-13 receptor subunit alpha-1-like isoform X3 [Ahaetulla prasina]
MGLPWQPQLLAHLAGVVLAAGAFSTLPSPPNISYVFDESSCILSVRWDPVRLPPGNPCGEMYYTGLFNGKTWIQENWSDVLSKKMAVLLGKNMTFGLRTACRNNSDEGELFKIPLEQNGTPETGATNVSCICHNMEWMACSWKRGRRAPLDTSYNLSFWHDNLEEWQRCTNRSVDGDTFRCVFPINCSGERTLVLSVRSGSKDIQPVCVLTKEDYPIKLNPPSNLKIVEGNNVRFLTWHAPSSWSGICYNIEKNGVRNESYEDDTKVTITLEAKKYHTLRVRAVLGAIGRNCKEVRGLWSEWSEAIYWDDRDKFEILDIVLFVTIPLCAAVLTIVLLIYLKRIQLLIFPKIPDPEKVLKRIFEDQREEYLPVEYPSEFIKPDTISRNRLQDELAKGNPGLLLATLQEMRKSGCCLYIKRLLNVNQASPRLQDKDSSQEVMGGLLEKDLCTHSLIH